MTASRRLEAVRVFGCGNVMQRLRDRLTDDVGMGRPPGQSEGPYISPNIDREQDMADNGASPVIAKWIYIAVIVSMVVLGLLVGVGLHIPRG